MPSYDDDLKQIDDMLSRFKERNKDKIAIVIDCANKFYEERYPTRYSVVCYMDVLAHSDDEAQEVVDTVGKHLNCFENINNAKASFV